MPTVEKFIQRQPQGRETYDLLAKILITLKRENEIIPGSKSTPPTTPRTSRSSMPWPSGTRRRARSSKAKAIYNDLLDEQRETQGFGETFPRLVKERKTEELITLLVKVTGRFKRLDPVRAQIAELAADPAIPTRSSTPACG